MELITGPNDAEWVTIRVTYREAALLAFAASWLSISEAIPKQEAFDIASKILNAIQESEDVEDE